MASKINGKAPTTFSDINITPLTDIFLVLLIIMMVVAPMLQTTGLKLNTPSLETTDKVTEEPKVIKLSIAADDSLSVEGKSVNPLLLRNTLREWQLKKPDGLMVEANPQSSHTALTGALDAAQAVGLSKVAVTSAQPEASETTPPSPSSVEVSPQ